MTRVKIKKKRKTDHIFYHFCLVSLKFFSHQHQFYTTPYMLLFLFPMVFRCCSYFPPLPACYNIRQFPFLVVVVVSLSCIFTPSSDCCCADFFLIPKTKKWWWTTSLASCSWRGWNSPSSFLLFKWQQTDIRAVVCVFLILDTSPNGLYHNINCITTFLFFSSSYKNNIFT